MLNSCDDYLLMHDTKIMCSGQLDLNFIDCAAAFITKPVPSILMYCAIEYFANIMLNED